MPKEHEADFAILTIVPEAWASAFAIFGEPSRWELRADQDWPVWEIGAEDGGTHAVVIDDPVDRFDIPAQEAAARMLEVWRPKQLLLADIGGAFSGRDDLRLGDLVVAENLEYYSLVKETAHGEEARKFAIAQPSLVPRRGLARLGHRLPKWASRIPLPHPDRRDPPKIVSGEIVVGERLLSDPSSPTVGYLAERYPQALALDMESVGVARAVYAAQQREIFTQFGVIRGISDFLDATQLSNQATRDKMKPYAAAAAVAAAAGYIYSSPTQDRDRGAVGKEPETERWIDDLIVDKTAGFVGRDNVFAAIDEFIADYDSGYFLLEGDPGAGKTSIIAEYVRRHGSLAYFNNRSQGLVTDAQFLEVLTREMGRRFKIAPRSTRTTGSSGQALRELLSDARQSDLAESPLVIAIDALDEANRGEADEAANLLGLPDRLPSGVYVIASSRRISLPLAVSSPLVKFDLGSHLEATLRDIRSYLRRRVRVNPLREALDKRAIPVDEFVDILSEKSEGNFMYLRHVLPELALEIADGKELTELPTGLENYYESHWRRMGMNEGLSLKVWVVYMLCELRRPVSSQVVSTVVSRAHTGVTAADVQLVFDEWLQFLHRDSSFRPARFSLYHTSFADFLHRKDIVAAAGLSLEEVNGHIADVLWDSEFGTAEKA